MLGQQHGKTVRRRIGLGNDLLGIYDSLVIVTVTNQAFEVASVVVYRRDGRSDVGIGLCFLEPPVTFCTGWHRESVLHARDIVVGNDGGRADAIQIADTCPVNLRHGKRLDILVYFPAQCPERQKADDRIRRMFGRRLDDGAGQPDVLDHLGRGVQGLAMLRPFDHRQTAAKQIVHDLVEIGDLAAGARIEARPFEVRPVGQCRLGLGGARFAQLDLVGIVRIAVDIHRGAGARQDRNGTDANDGERLARIFRQSINKHEKPPLPCSYLCRKSPGNISGFSLKH